MSLSDWQAFRSALKLHSFLAAAAFNIVFFEKKHIMASMSERFSEKVFHCG